MTVENIIEAFSVLFSWPLIGWMILAVLIGIIVGAIPGVGASLGMAIVLPLTLYMDRFVALVLLVGIYSGAMYGGSISAILINAPGTGGAAATTFDGYPLSRQGKAMEALAISATSSVFGGSLSLLVLILLTPVLITLVFMFGTPEYFLVAIVGLAMITVVAKSSIFKGLVGGAFGMLLATVGQAPNSPTMRFTFDNLSLYDGLSFVAVLIGLFAISEMIKLSTETGGIAKETSVMSGSLTSGVKTTLQKPVTVIKSAFIGMGVGAIPGAGSSVANFVAYAEAVRASKNPDEFGSGKPEGVIAPEASNNGSIGGSLIPTLAFGIPGSGATAVLLGGLLMHGLRPGAALFDTEIVTTYVMLLSILVGNVVILIFGLFVVTKIGGPITQVNTDFIIPMVIVLSLLGGYTLRQNWVDILTILVLGIIGFYMVKHNFSIIALVLGVILGPIAEENLYRSLQISGGEWSIFVTRPISLLLTLAFVLIIFSPILSELRSEITS